MKVLFANPHGFCAGVVMAIESLERSLELLGPPLYVFHEIVHNKYVVERFVRRGVVFVDSLEDVPGGSNLLFSAHGVSPEVRKLARQRKLRTIDATCPLVTKVHLEATKFARLGCTIVLVGHAGHDEVIGTMGEAPERIVLIETPEQVDQLEVKDPERVAYLTQTTLSVDDANRVIDALKRRFPNIVGPPKDDICYATQNRQDAVRKLASQADLVLVVGSQNSSNSVRLGEVAREYGASAYLIDGVRDLDPQWFAGVETVLLTAGASAPEDLVSECINWLREQFGAEVETRVVREENVYFPLPKALRPRDQNLSSARRTRPSKDMMLASSAGRNLSPNLPPEAPRSNQAWNSQPAETVSDSQICQERPNSTSVTGMVRVTLDS
ncbi:MAG: 4-hydroxy-3-methylbut-2-enyl diphosphate reductase [Planctomycetes bacterium]|nr:4-hydroxy-3-methylbut-2-enyl diphosphate reductase [Planctomycetota bacterium]